MGLATDAIVAVMKMIRMQRWIATSGPIPKIGARIS
jgi:hypothetical protein